MMVIMIVTLIMVFIAMGVIYMIMGKPLDMIRIICG